MSLALAFVFPPAIAQAAPPEPEEEVEPEPPSLDEAKLVVGRDMFARGQEHFDAEEYRQAIEMWQQVMILMPERRSSIRVNLAHAHRRTYAADEDPAHLREALTLFTEHVDDPKTSDVAREEIETQIAEIEAEFEAMAAAEEQERAAREQAIRDEQQRLAELALAQAELDHERSVNKIYFGIGGALAGVGVGSLAAMGAFLGLGAAAEARGIQKAGEVGSTESDYQALLSEGQSHNTNAIVTGVVGGALVAAGTTMLVIAGIRSKRLGPETKQEKKIAWSPGIGTIALHF